MGKAVEKMGSCDDYGKEGCVWGHRDSAKRIQRAMRMNYLQLLATVLMRLTTVWAKVKSMVVHPMDPTSAEHQAWVQLLWQAESVWKETQWEFQ